MSESFANWFYENKLLGYSYDKTLKEIFLSKLPSLVNTAEIAEMPMDSTVCFAARVVEVSEWTSKNEKKTKVFKMILSDEYGTISGLVFNDKIEFNKSANGDRLPVEEDVVIVKGRKKQDAIFMETFGIQTLKIYTKLSELKEKNLDNSTEKSNDSIA